mgnify:CR=1 FL=1
MQHNAVGLAVATLSLQSAAESNSHVVLVRQLHHLQKVLHVLEKRNVALEGESQQAAEAAAVMQAALRSTTMPVSQQGQSNGFPHPAAATGSAEEKAVRTVAAMRREEVGCEELQSALSGSLTVLRDAMTRLDGARAVLKRRVELLHQLIRRDLLCSQSLPCRPALAKTADIVVVAEKDAAGNSTPRSARRGMAGAGDAAAAGKGPAESQSGRSAAADWEHLCNDAFLQSGAAIEASLKARKEAASVKRRCDVKRAALKKQVFDAFSHELHEVTRDMHVTRGDVFTEEKRHHDVDRALRSTLEAQASLSSPRRVAKNRQTVRVMMGRDATNVALEDEAGVVGRGRKLLRKLAHQLEAESRRIDGSLETLRDRSAKLAQAATVDRTWLGLDNAVSVPGISNAQPQAPFCIRTYHHLAPFAVKCDPLSYHDDEDAAPPRHRGGGPARPSSAAVPGTATADALRHVVPRPPQPRAPRYLSSAVMASTTVEPSPEGGNCSVTQQQPPSRHHNEAAAGSSTTPEGFIRTNRNVLDVAPARPNTAAARPPKLPAHSSKGTVAARPLVPRR